MQPITKKRDNQTVIPAAKKQLPLDDGRNHHARDPLPWVFIVAIVVIMYTQQPNVWQCDRSL